MQKTRSLVSLLAFTAFAFVAAGCGGGGGGGTTAPVPGGGGGGATNPPPTLPPATAPPGVTLSGDINVGDGITNGALAKFNPATGDSSTGGNGQAVDNITCDSVMQSKFHVHAFVGFMVNGNEYALPATIGMKNPGAAVNGFVNSASCFYWLHTHDASGQVHVEAPATGSFTLGNLLDIWGQSSASIGTALGSSFNVYVGYSTGTLDSKGNPIVNNYQPFTGDISQLSLTNQRHPAIWFVVGNPTLPTVHFATEF